MSCWHRAYPLWQIGMREQGALTAAQARVTAGVAFGTIRCRPRGRVEQDYGAAARGAE